MRLVGASRNVAERLPGKQQTNNRAEMYVRSAELVMISVTGLTCSPPSQAVARILEMDPTPHLPLTICTDSQYTISGASLPVRLENALQMPRRSLLRMDSRLASQELAHSWQQIGRAHV